MTNSVASSLGTFVQSIVAIFSAVFDAILNVFYSFFALGQAVLTGVAQFGQSVLKLGLDVFQGVFGFVLANFFLLAVLGGGYYLYTQKQGGSVRKGKKRA